MSLPTSLRSLVRTPALALTIAFTLTPGTGAQTTTVGVVRAALWRQPPFPDAHRIGMLFPERNPRDESPRRERWSFARYALLAQSQDVFWHVASYSPAALTVSATPG